MDILNVLVGVSAIFWIAAGIKTHSDWIQSIFVNESKKIRQQTEIISEFGYGALNTRNTFEAKKGLVFAYWDKPLGKQKNIPSNCFWQNAKTLPKISEVTINRACQYMMSSQRAAEISVRARKEHVRNFLRSELAEAKKNFPEILKSLENCLPILKSIDGNTGNPM